MPIVSRRRVIQSAAALSIASPMAAFGREKTSQLSDIDHVIILMKENRSFDHYFGSLRGVRGFDDAAAAPLFRQADETNPDGYVLPFRLDTQLTNAQRLHDLNHSWKTQHRCWNKGGMDRWIAAHRKANSLYAPLTMGHMTRADLPFYYALADAFTICDAYHASVLGPTHPNRFYLMSATIDPQGRAGGPANDNFHVTNSWETYPERLSRAGISWRIYHDADDFGTNVCRYFTQYQSADPKSDLFDAAMRNRSLSELLSDLQRGNIPQVSWICPPSLVTEHPNHLPAAGEDHTAVVLRALWSNRKLWSRTAVILNYDENDGLFDHVAPPVPEAGTQDEFIGGAPIGLGFRVPCLVISPFSRGGYVCGDTLDHTSVLRLLEARFGVEISNLSSWRRQTCGDLTKAFGFGGPANLEIPVLPETTLRLAMALENADKLPPPQVPLAQAMPSQETGSRPRRI